MHQTFSKASVLALALGTSSALASTCNPLETANCPAVPGFTAPYTIDFTDAKYRSLAQGAAPDGWILPEYEYVSFGPNGLELKVDNAPYYDAPGLISSSYFQYGSFEVIMQTAPGIGVISSAVMMSDTDDEIDWEWSGNSFGNPNVQGNVQTNYFGKGVTDCWCRATMPELAFDPSKGFHNYTVAWTAQSTKWFVDGALIRTLNRADCTDSNKLYPQTSGRIHLGIWDAGTTKQIEGTRIWAGGVCDGTGCITPAEDLPATAYVKSVRITPYNTGCASYDYADQSGTEQSVSCQADAVKVQEIPVPTDENQGLGQQQSATVTAVVGNSFQNTSSVAPVASESVSITTSASESPSSITSTLGSENMASVSPSVANSDGVPMTTLTVYAITQYTVTSCASSVRNCPATSSPGQVVTVTDYVEVFTTVCPVSDVSSIIAPSSLTTLPPGSTPAPPASVTPSVTPSSESSTSSVAPTLSSSLESITSTLGSNLTTTSAPPSEIISTLSAPPNTTSSESFVFKPSVESRSSSSSVVFSNTTTAGPSTVSPTTPLSTAPAPTDLSSSVLVTTINGNVSSVPVYGFTESTVFATTTYTITSCKSNVINCPASPSAQTVVLTTEIIPMYVTICPVTLTETSSSSSSSIAPVATPSTVSPSVIPSGSTSSTGSTTTETLSSSGSTSVAPVWSPLTSGSSVSPSAGSSVKSEGTTSSSVSPSSGSSSSIARSSEASVAPSGSSSSTSNFVFKPTPATSVPMTTSTILSTSVFTTTTCAPEIPNCPAASQTHVSVVTRVITVGTTICPVSETYTASLVPPNGPLFVNTTYTTGLAPVTTQTAVFQNTAIVANGTTAHTSTSVGLTSVTVTPSSVVTTSMTFVPPGTNVVASVPITLYSTQVITITSCASTVTDCPARTSPIVTTKTEMIVTSTAIPPGPGSTYVAPVPTTSNPALITSTEVATKVVSTSGTESVITQTFIQVSSISTIYSSAVSTITPSSGPPVITTILVAISTTICPVTELEKTFPTTSGAPIPSSASQSQVASSPPVVTLMTTSLLTTSSVLTTTSTTVKEGTTSVVTLLQTTTAVQTVSLSSVVSQTQSAKPVTSGSHSTTKSTVTSTSTNTVKASSGMAPVGTGNAHPSGMGKITSTATPSVKPVAVTAGAVEAFKIKKVGMAVVIVLAGTLLV